MKRLLYLPAHLFLLVLLAFPAFGQWTVTNLSQAKVQMGAAALSTKAYFGGGLGANGLTNKVEIYDVAADDWSIANLSVARAFPAGATIGSKVFFAGGLNWNTLQHYAAVDLFDTLSQQWSTATLAAPRMYAQALTVGGNILFAGGYKILSFSPLAMDVFDVVDIYHDATGTWSTQSLSQARAAMGVAAVGNLAFFAGGQTSVSTVSDRVDIYNASTGLWSTSTLSEPRAFCAAATVGSKVLIAGGVTNDNVPSDRVDIFDVATGLWSTASLSEARCFTTMGASACGKAFFAAGGTLNLLTFSFETASNVVDIYDPATGNWSVDNLQKSVINHSVVAAQNHILVAGGLEFPNTVYKTVEIFTCQASSGAVETGAKKLGVDLFPNPATETLTIGIPTDSGEIFRVKIFDLNGNLMQGFEMTGSAPVVVDMADWGAGAYFVKVLSAKGAEVEKIFKI